MKLFLGSITLLVFNSLFLGSAFAQSYDVSGVQVLMTPSQVETVLSANGYLPDNKYKVVDRDELKAAILKASETHGKIYTTKEFEKADTNKITQPNFNQQVALKRKDPATHTVLDTNLLRLTRDKYAAGPTQDLRAIAFQKHGNGNRETIFVEFTAFPSGSRVSKVTYKLDDSKISASDFRAKAIEKYGKPNAGRAHVGDELLSQDNIEGREQLNIGLGRITLSHKNYQSYNKALNAAVQSLEDAANPYSDKKGTSF